MAATEKIPDLRERILDMRRNVLNGRHRFGDRLY
jgi:hypothetical protein